MLLTHIADGQGLNCSVRLVKRKKGGGGGGRRCKKDGNVGGQKSGEAVGMDLDDHEDSRGSGIAARGVDASSSCRAGDKKGGMLVSRTWWDGLSKGKHSSGRNELVYRCGECGKSLGYGGSDVKACAAMVVARGKERRGQRFRDREAAERQERLEKASAFIHSEGLGSTGERREKKKKVRSRQISNTLL